MERKGGGKKSEKQNRQGDAGMSGGMCGRGWKIKARDKQDLRVNLGKLLNIKCWKI